jgi:hypothetical protein
MIAVNVARDMARKDRKTYLVASRGVDPGPQRRDLYFSFRSSRCPRSIHQRHARTDAIRGIHPPPLLPHFYPALTHGQPV